MSSRLDKEILLRKDKLFFGEKRNNFSDIFLIDLINCFLAQLSNEGTRTRYFFCFKKLFRENVLCETFTLNDLKKLNLNARLDSILLINSLSKHSRQTCAAAFLSFFKFLHRETGGLIKAPIPQKTGVSKTFSRIRDKTVYSPISKSDLFRFIERSYQHSLRMGIFVEMAIQSTRRLSELLDTKFSDINWIEKTIKFSTVKTQIERQCTIAFPNRFMKKLKEFRDRFPDKNFIFSTSSGKKIQKDYVWRQLSSISGSCNLSYRITPHVLRATSIAMYREYGFSLGDIIEITGHSSIEMVRYYDKNSFKNNPSCKVALI
ncbi:tyrosine-type recombinase/integrase [Chlamydiifrater volucris]|uniref:tyrosine-type recombinase/integrase n=1 Tax=Chlamydiifrater volucris TaxID=2681470 RepID=UPI001BCA9541|nr:site-specific integrase [Chlamydiifrater volucris]